MEQVTGLHAIKDQTATFMFDRPDGTRCVQYHNTVVVAANSSLGTLELNTGGFRTNTTKKRINTWANSLLPFRERDDWILVYQEKGVWRIRIELAGVYRLYHDEEAFRNKFPADACKGETVDLFTDGMVIAREQP